MALFEDVSRPGADATTTIVSAPTLAALADEFARTYGGKTVHRKALGAPADEESTGDILFVAADEATLPLLRFDSHLVALRKAVRLGAPAYFAVVLSSADAAQREAARLVSELTLSGFEDVSAAPAVREITPGLFVGQVSSKAPAFAPGAAAKYVPRAKATPAAASAWGALPATADLVDEDALIDGDVVTRPAEAAGASSAGGCAPKRTACKNCSCGRKEAEAAVQVDPSAAAAPAAKSASCGNCHKGDAFRCGTCPFLGKPAWAPGEDGSVLLDTASDF